MSLKARYQTLNLYKFQEGNFSEPAGYMFEKTFKGLIQPSTGSKVYNNGKDTTSVDALLFCSEKETFEEKDIIEYKNSRFKIAGANIKPDGITGVTPKQGQHAEYNLVYTQESVF